MNNGKTKLIAILAIYLVVVAPMLTAIVTRDNGLTFSVFCIGVCLAWILIVNYSVRLPKKSKRVEKPKRKNSDVVYAHSPITRLTARQIADAFMMGVIDSQTALDKMMELGYRLTDAGMKLEMLCQDIITERLSDKLLFPYNRYGEYLDYAKQKRIDRLTENMRRASQWWQTVHNDSQDIGENET